MATVVLNLGIVTVRQYINALKRCINLNTFSLTSAQKGIFLFNNVAVSQIFVISIQKLTIDLKKETVN